jgi:hypothetical protein
MNFSVELSSLPLISGCIFQEPVLYRIYLEKVCNKFLTPAFSADKKTMKVR